MIDVWSLLYTLLVGHKSWLKFAHNFVSNLLRVLTYPTNWTIRMSRTDSLTAMPLASSRTSERRTQTAESSGSIATVYRDARRSGSHRCRDIKGEELAVLLLWPATNPIMGALFFGLFGSSFVAFSSMLFQLRVYRIAVSEMIGTGVVGAAGGCLGLVVYFLTRNIDIVRAVFYFNAFLVSVLGPLVAISVMPIDQSSTVQSQYLNLLALEYCGILIVISIVMGIFVGIVGMSYIHDMWNIFQYPDFAYYALLSRRERRPQQQSALQQMYFSFVLRRSDPGYISSRISQDSSV